MKLKSIARLPLYFVLITISAMGSRAGAATPEEVDAAVDKAQKYLYSQQNKSGNWETDKAAEAHNWGGYTALAVYALLASGESYQDPRIAKGIAFLEKEEIVGTYAVGLRCQIWNLVHMNPAVRTARDRDGAQLLKSVGMPPDKDAGLYDYSATATRIGPRHNSPSQYGVLGMWALEEAGFEVSQKYWELVDAAWRRNQANDGGWSYLPHPSAESPVKASMTAAGVASLFITNDYLHSNDGINCKGNITNDNIENGLSWMGKHFAEVGGELYSLYGVERIGVASGYKYFGKNDWYAIGSETLVRGQSPDGSWASGWGVVPGTSFAVLFLSRGRAPVAFNKLDYETVGVVAGGGPAPRVRAHGPKESINWNERPRDIANIVHWIGHQTERDLNWQVINLAGSVDDFHDAPILYISGDGPPAITPDEEKKLRQYVEEGGMILGNADCGRKAFADGFKELGRRLFPKYEFEELPASHLIYTSNPYKQAKWKIKPSVLGLSNGVRELMLLIPQSDPARFWQTRAELTKKESFELAADIYLYSIDSENSLFKGATYLVKDKGGPVDRSVKVVRLNAGEDPEPGGWRRMANILKNDNKVDLKIELAKPGEGKLAGAQLATLTGTAAFTLSADERNEMKSFVEKGGTLLVDAAGGSVRFADSAMKEMNAIFGDAAAALRSPLLPSDLVYNVPGRPPITAVAYRRSAIGTRVGKSTAPRLAGIPFGKRTGVFFSRDDLSAGIVGESVEGVFGYTPASATELVHNIVLYAAVGGNFPKPATKPTTGPATGPATQPTAPPAAPPTAPAPPAPAATAPAAQ